jgi:hypothetical protein
VAASKALEAWQELNDRQQGTLKVLFTLDQQAEEERRERGARGHWDKTPASEWRLIDFSLLPAREFGAPGRYLDHGMTTAQRLLAEAGWDSQGNGATLAALEHRGLIRTATRSTGTSHGMRCVALTTAGRSAARAGLRMPTRKAALPAWAWEALIDLWEAGQDGGYVHRRESEALEKALMTRHVPPLAERVPASEENKFRGGYRITGRGRDFYAEFYAQHAAAYPHVRAPHPGGPAAEPWPKVIDGILGEHSALYQVLAGQWDAAATAARTADEEAAAPPPQPKPGTPPAVAEMAAARHQLWTETARQRAELAAAHADDLAARASYAARAYAVTATTAFNAAVAGAIAVGQVQPPVPDPDDWDEPRLAPPAETGIAVIDEQARRLHQDAAGTPVRRRGPAPKWRNRYKFYGTPKPEKPGDKHAALAAFLCKHAEGGELLRRLHPTAPEPR